MEKIRLLSPTELSVWFHRKMWSKIRSKSTDLVLPHRHQPHNGKKPNDMKIELSTLNLIRLTEHFCFLDAEECRKQYHHSKAVAILMMKPEKGGCYACGGLTSQTLLYTLACIGLIPIHVTYWAEMAATDTVRFLQDHYHLQYSEGRAEQFMSCVVAVSSGRTPEQVENRICKWARWKKRAINRCSTDVVTPFRDAIWPNQNIYQPYGGKLIVWNPAGKRVIQPPAMLWPRIGSKRPCIESLFWEQPTGSSKKRVLGSNRQRKGNNEKIEKNVTVQKKGTPKTYTCKVLVKRLPPTLAIILQSYCTFLPLSVTNLITEVLQEGTAIRKEQIIAFTKRRRIGFYFAVIDKTGHRHEAPDPAINFLCAQNCRLFGSIHFALRTQPTILASYLFRLLETDQAKEQIYRRGKNHYGEYYILHDNDGRTKSKRMVLGVVRFLSPQQIVLALFDEKYHSPEMNFSVFTKQ